ncbi:Octapeptide-repeat protein T2, partial [Ophiophagus hannah]
MKVSWVTGPITRRQLDPKITLILSRTRFTPTRNVSHTHPMRAPQLAALHRRELGCVIICGSENARKLQMLSALGERGWHSANALPPRTPIASEPKLGRGTQVGHVEKDQRKSEKGREGRRKEDGEREREGKEGRRKRGMKRRKEGRKVERGKNGGREEGRKMERGKDGVGERDERRKERGKGMEEEQEGRKEGRKEEDGERERGMEEEKKGGRWREGKRRMEEKKEGREGGREGGKRMEKKEGREHGENRREGKEEGIGEGRSGPVLSPSLDGSQAAQRREREVIPVQKNMVFYLGVSAARQDCGGNTTRPLLSEFRPTLRPSLPPLLSEFTGFDHVASGILLTVVIQGLIPSHALQCRCHIERSVVANQPFGAPVPKIVRALALARSCASTQKAMRTPTHTHPAHAPLPALRLTADFRPVTGLFQPPRGFAGRIIGPFHHFQYYSFPAACVPAQIVLHATCGTHAIGSPSQL